MLAGLRSSQKKPGLLAQVLWEVLWEYYRVLWENNCVMGILECL